MQTVSTKRANNQFVDRELEHPFDETTINFRSSDEISLYTSKKHVPLKDELLTLTF